MEQRVGGNRIEKNANPSQGYWGEGARTGMLPSCPPMFSQSWSSTFRRGLLNDRCIQLLTSPQLEKGCWTIIGLDTSLLKEIPQEL